MKRWKRMACLLLVGGLLAMLPGTAWADTDDEEETDTEIAITGVSLRLESKIRAGSGSSNVNVTAGSSLYTVDGVDVINAPKRNWQAGDKPEIRITLEADYGYYFESGMARRDISLGGAGGEVSQVTGKHSTLWVDVVLARLDGSSAGKDESDDYYGKIDSHGPQAGDISDEDFDDEYDDEYDDAYENEYDGDYDLEIIGAEWDESDGVAIWEESGDARRYEVRLLRNGRSVQGPVTTTDTQHDFSQDITKSGEYTFKVRAVYNSSNKGDWEESDTWYLSKEDLDLWEENGDGRSADGGYHGAWLKDDVGWWYCNADKSYTKSNWQLIDGLWYYFNESGYMVTGWVEWQGKWYYCGDNGAMLTNARTPGGYVVGGDGGWRQ